MLLFFSCVILHGVQREKKRLTEDESRKEKVDPSHDNGLGHNVHDVLLHAVHHGLDVGRVGHQVALGLVAADGVLEVRALLEGLAQVGLARLESLLGQVAAVRTENRGALESLTIKRENEKKVSAEKESPSLGKEKLGRCNDLSDGRDPRRPSIDVLR